MKSPLRSIFPAVLFSLATSALHAEPTTQKCIPVDSSAFVFSPGNWSGDNGRGGSVFRQTWNSGAYCRVTWETTGTGANATLLLDTSAYPPKFRPPTLNYCLDGVWKIGMPCQAEIPIPELKTAGRHELYVMMNSSEQHDRWGSSAASPLNVLRIKGLSVSTESTPIPGTIQPKWALFVGDSITEGIGATGISVYSHLLGEALQTQGWEYGISACGSSGWFHRGDNSGDVPAYYALKPNGEYDDAASRWNKIDGFNHSLLDSKGHISAYGQTGQEPSLIYINYGTNDRGAATQFSKTAAQGLDALRKAAPQALIVVQIPFGQYLRNEIKSAIATYQAAHPEDRKVAIIDLGQAEANNLDVKGPMGDLHPNPLGHARFAAQILPRLLPLLNEKK